MCPAMGNWDWGRAIPRKGIHKWDFRCSEDRQGEGRHEAKQAGWEEKLRNLVVLKKGLEVTQWDLEENQDMIFNTKISRTLFTCHYFHIFVQWNDLWLNTDLYLTKNLHFMNMQLNAGPKQYK